MADRQDEGLRLLKEIRNINRMIEELQEQIDDVYTMLTSTTVKPKEVNVQTSGSKDSLATNIARVIEYQEQLQNYQGELCERKKIALKVIQQMEIDKQQVLVLRYFKGFSIETIGEKVGYTYRWAWEKIHQAEEEFIEIYEKTT